MVFVHCKDGQEIVQLTLLTLTWGRETGTERQLWGQEVGSREDAENQKSG